MRYEVSRFTPEFRAIGYTLLILKVSLLYALYESIVSVGFFFAAFIVIYLISIVVTYQQSEYVDEHEITLHN
jgi:hypothetical protein